MTAVPSTDYGLDRLLDGLHEAVAVTASPEWIPDEHAAECCCCVVKFSVTRRKHHCRQCGQIVCGACSQHRALLPSLGFADKVRICIHCHCAMMCHKRGISLSKLRDFVSTRAAWANQTDGSAAWYCGSDELRKSELIVQQHSVSDAIKKWETQLAEHQKNCNEKEENLVRSNLNDLLKDFNQIWDELSKLRDRNGFIGIVSLDALTPINVMDRTSECWQRLLVIMPEPPLIAVSGPILPIGEALASSLNSSTITQKWRFATGDRSALPFCMVRTIDEMKAVQAQNVPRMNDSLTSISWFMHKESQVVKAHPSSLGSPGSKKIGGVEAGSRHSNPSLGSTTSTRSSPHSSTRSNARHSSPHSNANTNTAKTMKKVVSGIGSLVVGKAASPWEDQQAHLIIINSLEGWLGVTQQRGRSNSSSVGGVGLAGSLTHAEATPRGSANNSRNPSPKLRVSSNVSASNKPVNHPKLDDNEQANRSRYIPPYLKNEVMECLLEMRSTHQERVKVQKQVLKQWQTFKTTFVDWAEPQHAKLLFRLWKALKPDQECPMPQDERWKDIGFQGSDPVTDFRGMGLLSLTCCVFWAETYPAVAHKLLQQDREYPVCCAIINVVNLVCNLVGIGNQQMVEPYSPLFRLYCRSFRLARGEEQKTLRQWLTPEPTPDVSEAEEEDSDVRLDSDSVAGHVRLDSDSVARLVSTDASVATLVSTDVSRVQHDSRGSSESSQQGSMSPKMKIFVFKPTRSKSPKAGSSQAQTSSTNNNRFRQFEPVCLSSTETEEWDLAPRSRSRRRSHSAPIPIHCRPSPSVLKENPEHLFQETVCSVFHLLDHVFVSNKAGYMQFGNVMKTVQTFVSRSLKLGDGAGPLDWNEFRAMLEKAASTDFSVVGTAPSAGSGSTAGAASRGKQQRESRGEKRSLHPMAQSRIPCGPGPGPTLSSWNYAEVARGGQQEDQEEVKGEGEEGEEHREEHREEHVEDGEEHGEEHGEESSTSSVSDDEQDVMAAAGLSSCDPDDGANVSRVRRASLMRAEAREAEGDADPPLPQFSEQLGVPPAFTVDTFFTPNARHRATMPPKNRTVL